MTYYYQKDQNISSNFNFEDGSNASEYFYLSPALLGANCKK
jgi:hypothetical protein